MANISGGPVVKIVGKLALTCLIYGIAVGFTQRIWR